MRKIILGILSLTATLCLSTACSDLPLDFLNFGESASSALSETDESTDESSSTEASSKDDNSDETSSPEDDSSVQGGETDSTAEAILRAAYALESGESLMGTYTLTGVVTDVEKRSQGDICLTFIVGDFTDMPMYCYWLQDADFVEEGYEITVSGTIKRHYELVEFVHPELLSWKAPTGSGTGSGGSTVSHTYTTFTQAEKGDFEDLLGEVIPFIANDEYYVEEYTLDYQDGTGEVGYNFYTYGNTQAEFSAYLAQYSASGYDSAGTEEDEYGNTWYYFDKAEFYVDFSYYQSEGEWIVDVYAYIITEMDGSGSGSGSGTTENVDLLTNAGKGLPTGTNGVYEADFTKATYVKNVTEQGYYLDGCPTTGEPQVLIVPVEFSDVTAASKGYTIDKIEKAFNGTGNDTDYYSVRDYYYTSSYGQLDIQFTVLNEWFRPQETSSYYSDYTMDYYGSEMQAGDQLILDELLQYLEGKMDLSAFDSDENGTIDAVVFINTLEINSEEVFYWAYRYWNIYTDDDGDYYTYDGVSANDYLWAPYQFLYETYDAQGNVSYDNSTMNTYTYIHEFGHVLGADDYYDTSYVGSPMSGCDVMDSMPGDHNAYSKFNYGWLTSSRVIVAEESVTVQLEAFEKNGDTLIIANNWDEALGVYQEYYVLVYYTNSGLNSGDGGYFARDGVVVYHVNASLYAETQGETTYYDVYNNNTDPSDEYGTEDNLLEFVKSTADEFTYVVGSAISANTKDSQGNKIAYTFSIDALTANEATITFTKNI